MTQAGQRTVKLKKSNYVVQDFPSIRSSIIIWCRTSKVTSNQLLSNYVVHLPSAVTSNQLLSNYFVQDLPSIRCSIIL